MVDLGISFADGTLPGVEIVLPDPTFIADRSEDLCGLVLTHAHEDHFGASLTLAAPGMSRSTARGFTAIVLARRLEEAGIKADPDPPCYPGHRFPVGPSMQPAAGDPLIPESQGAGDSDRARQRLLPLATGSSNPAPLVGALTATDDLEAFGREGVLADGRGLEQYPKSGTSGSEAEVRDSLAKLIEPIATRVVLTTFASNIARLETAARVAQAVGRRAAPVGRSMHRMIEAAREVGYLEGLPPLLDERAARDLSRRKVLWLATGCQAEPRAALSRIAAGRASERQDSSRATWSSSPPRSPRQPAYLYDLPTTALGEPGIEVITEHDHFVHVSGHPCRTRSSRCITGSVRRSRSRSTASRGTCTSIYVRANFGVPRRSRSRTVIS